MKQDMAVTQEVIPYLQLHVQFLHGVTEIGTS